MLVSVAHIAPDTRAEGPGRRFALWFQGCPLRCPGCCNPQMQPFEGGRGYPLDDLIALIKLAKLSGVEGITLLGGEPTSHAPAARRLAEAAKSLGLTVMVFSGFRLAHLIARGDPDVRGLIDCTDVLVDGPYDRRLPDTRRRWIGSTNQEIHFLTGAYEGDPCWEGRNTVEIRLARGKLEVNGFPTAAVEGMLSPLEWHHGPRDDRQELRPPHAE